MAKESACNAGDSRDSSSIPRSRRSPGEGNSKPLQYSCLENPMTEELVCHVWAAKKLDTTDAIEQKQCSPRINI